MSMSSNTKDRPVEGGTSDQDAVVDRLDLRDIADVVSGIEETELAASTENKQLEISFMDLPPEVREIVISEYLLEEHETGTLHKCLHFDGYGKACCIWSWPDELIMCDKAREEDLPSLMFPKWLPNLALVSMAMRGEVTNIMLRTTDAITFKYYKERSVKIVPWFSKFLETLSGGNKDGFNAVHRLSFPHEHWYNNDRKDCIVDEENPDVQLMLRCPKLWRISMTFHVFKLRVLDEHGHHLPRPLHDFLEWFHLRPILECKELKEVHLDGILRGDMVGPQLQTLRDFGKWLREGFEKRGQTVDVRLHARSGIYKGRGEGEKL